jgi:hypothetical protein
MTLQFYGNGKLSEGWIEDRRPDGSVVMLICSPGATRASTSDGGEVSLFESSRVEWSGVELAGPLTPSCARRRSSTADWPHCTSIRRNCQVAFSVSS